MGNNTTMAQDDLKKAELPQLDWGDPSGSLSLVYRHVVAHARDAEDWYTRKRRSKKAGGQALRVASIMLVGLAGLLPILAEIYTHDGIPVIAPGWASVALVLAATLVAFDRYFGLSTGWTRFMKAELRIAALRHDFEFEWQRARASVGDDPARMLELAQRFVLAVDEAVIEETGTWASDFRESLDGVDSELKAHTG